MPFLDSGRSASSAAGDGLNPRVVWLLRQAKSASEPGPKPRPALSLLDEAEAVLSQIERLEVHKARLEGRIVDAYAALHSVEEQHLSQLVSPRRCPSRPTRS